MNNAVFVNKGALTASLVPNWKKLNKRMRLTLLGLWTLEDENIYNELSKNGKDKSVKIRPNFSSTGKGKEKRDQNRQDRKDRKSRGRQPRKNNNTQYDDEY
jgi:hypothetical protein